MPKRKIKAPVYRLQDESAGQRIAAALEIPPDFIGSSHIEMDGSRHLIIEGCRRVLCYDENLISLDLKQTHIQITGTYLCFKMINKRQLVIIGNISSVEFVSINR